jgi:hypothetical protein
VVITAHFHTVHGAVRRHERTGASLPG